jgi:Tol biopolymer transport system component
MRKTQMGDQTRRPRVLFVLTAALVLLSCALVTTAGATTRAAASRPNPARGLRGLLVFSRQICASETDPCWEIVVSDAHEDHDRVVAGPYPREVWDDHFLPNWAPEGRSVIFMADLGTGQKIWRVRANGTHLHAIFTPPAGTFLDDGPVFTPDGRHIIFTRCCQPEVVTGYALWSITPDGRHLQQVTSEAVPPGVDGPSDNLPQVSPNGREVTYSRNVVDPSGGTLGSRITTACLRTGAYNEITDPTVLDAGIPNWTPDGRKIAFQSVSNDGSINIWRVNRNGTHLTPLSDDGASLNPSYTPDGHLLLARIDADGGRDLYVARPDGSHPTLIRATEGLERFPHLIQPTH